MNVLRTRNAVSVHEAGHAVLGLLQGYSIASIELAPAGFGDLWAGRTMPMDAPQGDVKKAALFYLGGPCAAAIFCETPLDLNAESNRGDKTNIASVVSDSAQLESLAREAFQLCKTHWGTIGAVARELLAEGKLTGVRVHEIFAARTGIKSEAAPATTPRQTLSNVVPKTLLEDEDFDATFKRIEERRERAAEYWRQREEKAVAEAERNIVERVERLRTGNYV